MNSVSHSFKALVVGLAFGLSATAHAGVIADLQTDWSNSFNPNGAWQYREGNIDLSPVASWLPLGQFAWANPGNVGGDFLPAVFEGAHRQAAFNAGFLDFSLGDIGVATNDCGNGGNKCNLPVNVMWTSTVNGSVTISGDVWAADLIFGRGSAFTVTVNGGLPLVSGDALAGINTRSSPVNFSVIDNIQVGDQIVLTVTNKQEAGTWAGINLTISTNDEIGAPTPGALALLGLGLIGFGAIRRRRG